MYNKVYERFIHHSKHTTRHKMKGSAMLSTWFSVSFLITFLTTRAQKLLLRSLPQEIQSPINTHLSLFLFVWPSEKLLKKIQRSVDHAIKEVPDHTALKSASGTWMSTSPQLQQLSVDILLVYIKYRVSQLSLVWSEWLHLHQGFLAFDTGRQVSSMARTIILGQHGSCVY